MAETVHKKLQRVRRPRVHIKYKVETGDATIVKKATMCIQQPRTTTLLASVTFLVEIAES